MDRRVSLQWVWIAVLILFLTSLGCSVCPFVPQLPTDTPVPPTDMPAPQATPIPTSTPEPTPTSETAVEMLAYTNALAGFSILYPQDWVYQSEGSGAFFAESDEALEAAEISEAPFFAVLAGVPQDIEYEFGTVATAQDLLDAVMEGMCEEGCEVGQSEDLTFGELQGVGVQASWLETWSETRIQGYFVAAVGDEVAGIGLGAVTEEDWPSYEQIFADMFASLEFFPPELPEPVDRGTIRPGETVEGDLVSGSKEVWTFDAQEGQYVTIWLDAAITDELDTYLELYDAEGVVIAEDDDGGASTNSLIADFQIDASGDYAIHASPYSGGGEYVLGLEISDAPSGGGEIAYGETVEATLRGGAEHAWVFSGDAGDEISIAMRALTDKEELDCYLELYSSDGDALISDDDSGESLNAWIEYFVLPTDGLYRIVASDLSGEAGEYALTLETAQLEIAGTLVPGQAVAATFELGARHHWLFEGQAGEIVSISTLALDEDLDTYMELFSPDGEQVATDDDGGEGSNAAISEFSLTHTGTYRVVARAYNEEQAGEYEITLEMVELEIEGTLVYDQVTTATLEPDERHYWLFEGQAGDVVSISMIATGEDLDTYLELFAPSGEQVVVDDDSGGDSNAAILEFELPLDGTFRIVARGYNEYGAGEYELTLTGP